MLTRRSLLRLGLGAGVAGAVAGPLTQTFAAAAPAAAGAGTSSAAAAQFTVPLTTPPVLSPLWKSSTTDYYAVVMRKARTEILPGRSTDVLTYNGSFPGPTLRARSGRRAVVQQFNLLDTPTSPHLHGGSVPEASDGGRMQYMIDPMRTRTYTYPNHQSHATLWTHDHAHHTAAESVYRGLASAYVLQDDTELGLGLPSGKYDVPLVLRDADLDENAQLVWTMDDPFNRTTIMVNGRAWPYMKVEGRKYRFRLVNASNLRIFILRLSDGSPVTQIGTGGGLLEKPYTSPVMVISPGERIDFVIDFAQYAPGTQLVLNNLIGPGPTDLIGNVMRFDVGKPVADDSTVPDTLQTLPALPKPTVERDFTMSMDAPGTGGKGYINGKTYDPDRIDTAIDFGATEVWSVKNIDPALPHNFHTHLVQFRILERDGAPVPPPEAGLKDTVLLFPGQSVKLQLTFDSYRGVFPYHCHMLDHAAMGMMAQMKIA